ncbi:MAG: SDR family oxidoreductase [Candidatus Aminicenantes bacterium]|nr:MAG: SDR family oxidoreductase [Candidatus Aminicenantes bacterium]
MTDQHGITGFEVAVIGMAGRFAGAKNIAEFWNNLKNGMESIAFFSEEELERDGIDSTRINSPHYVKARGVLEKREYFDPSFFGYTPIEAEMMDPQMRIFHEITWEALEDAGYAGQSHKRLIGLYAGAGINHYWEALSTFFTKGSEVAAWNSVHFIDKDYFTLRISYALNLTGPSFPVFTACSTSLVAVHLACQALLNGECDLALAGGVTVVLPTYIGYMYQEGMIMSPDGHCRAFDASAKGTTGGSGAGIVALKLLEDALEDRDHIYAVIKGSAINNDGMRKGGFTAPAVEGQAEVIRAAQQAGHVEPESISYIEAHGTGTSLGDPIEIEALKLAFNTGKKGYCAIGSIKTNVGHLDTAAGVAGLIKLVLALKYKLIPPNLHFEAPNPEIDFTNSPFYVNTTLKEWKRDGGPLRAGVSSFGIGGTNAHVILEEAPEGTGGLAPWSNADTPRKYRLILLSAKTESALERMTQNLLDYLKRNHGNHETHENPGPTLADAVYTLQVGRQAFKHRRMLVCSTINEAIPALENPGAEKVQTSYAKEEKKHVVFMFSGQGPQYINMGLDIYREEPSFRADVDRCLDILKSIFGRDVKHILFPGKEQTEKKETPSRESIDDVIYSGPIKFIMDYSLARLLIKWGIQPHSLIGHSFGEYVAACLSGVFSLEDALQAVVWRGQLMKKTPKGVMMSVPLPEEELKPLLNEDLFLAAVNTSSLCIVSGTFAATDKLENQLSEKGYECVRLNFPHPSHSRMMEPILGEFQEKIRRLKRNKPLIPYISNVTGTWITAQQATDPAYWATHMRKTVRFTDGISELLKETDPVFIQVGPGRGLTLFVDQHQDKTPGNLAINLLRHPKEDVSDVYFLLKKIGLLWLSGVNIDWQEFYSNEKRYRMPLPPYPFDERRCWKHVDNFLKNKSKRFDGGELKKNPDIADWFYVPSWERTMLPPRHVGDPPHQSCWLVFTDACGLGHNLRKRLEQEGRKVIEVRTGSAFGKVNDGEFTVNPTAARDYESLFTQLAELKNIPQKILHLWSVTPVENPGKALEPSRIDKAQSLGILSLLNLVKAIGKQDIIDEMQIFAVSNNMQEVTGEEELCPEKATLLGPIIVIPQEFPNVTCRSIDIMLPGPGSTPEQEDRLVDQLLVEFQAKSSNPMIAYRGNYRWEQTFKQVRLEESAKTTPRLRQQGVYLITGGLGRIGLILAEHFARAVKAKLILTGRSALPPRQEWNQWLSAPGKDDKIKRKIRKVMELEELGAEVLVLKADVENLKQMQQLMNTIDETFGGLNGVVHAAGVIDARAIQIIKSMDINECYRQFQPKVYGLLVLEKVLQGRELDFCSLTSSISSVLGGLGHVVYSAANIFMDAYVHKHNRVNKVRWTSINWEIWQFRKKKVLTATVGETLEKLALTPEQGIEAFLRVLAWPEASQVLNSSGDLHTRLQQWVQREHQEEEEENDSMPEDSAWLNNRPDLSTQYVPPANELEQRLAETWKSFFGIQNVGRDDDFFELGGDSLKAMIVASIIHKKFNVKVSVTNIFTAPTIKELAEYINDRAQKIKYSSIEPAEKREYYPQSSTQKRLFFLGHFEDIGTSYNMPYILKIQGKMETERYEKTFNALIARHEALRTSFEIVASNPVQRVHPVEALAFAIEHYDLATENTENKEETRGLAPLPIEPVTVLINSFIRPFDLSKAPLLRVGLMKLSEGEYLLLFDMHHIIGDGTSMEILTEEFIKLYTGGEVPALRIQYKDFFLWQNNLFKTGKIKEQEDYWLNLYADIDDIPFLNLPFDYPRQDIFNFEGALYSFKLEAEDTLAFKKLAKENGATLYMNLLAVFNVLLHIYSGQDDIIVGTGIAGRPHADLQNIIGMFVNTLAIRNYPEEEKTYLGFLNEVKNNCIKAFENQDLQFEELVERIRPGRTPSRNPIFSVELNVQNFERPAPGNQKNEPVENRAITSYGFEHTTSKFDMSLYAADAGETINFIMEYSTALFKLTTIKKIARRYIRIIKQVVKNKTIKLKDIKISHDLLEAHPTKIGTDFRL